MKKSNENEWKLEKKYGKMRATRAFTLPSALAWRTKFLMSGTEQKKMVEEKKGWKRCSKFYDRQVQVDDGYLAVNQRSNGQHPNRITNNCTRVKWQRKKSVCQ